MMSAAFCCKTGPSSSIYTCLRKRFTENVERESLLYCGNGNVCFLTYVVRHTFISSNIACQKGVEFSIQLSVAGDNVAKIFSYKKYFVCDKPELNTESPLYIDKLAVFDNSR